MLKKISGLQAKLDWGACRTAARGGGARYFRGRCTLIVIIGRSARFFRVNRG